MSKFLEKLVSVTAVCAGVYAVGKYLSDYTDFKAAKKEDLSQLKSGTEKAKDAAKRTYIAIKNRDDVTSPAGDLGRAVAEVAEGAGRAVTAVGSNTVAFAKNEKEKYDADPEGYKAQVSDNLKDMGKQTADLFDSIKTGAENLMHDVKQTAENFASDPEDFVSPEEEETAEAETEAEAEAETEAEADHTPAETSEGIEVTEDTEEIK